MNLFRLWQSSSVQQKSMTHAHIFSALRLVIQNIYSAIMGWMSASPWVRLTAGSRKQPIKHALTDGDKWKNFTNLSQSWHLQYSNRLGHKDCEMRQTLTGLFFIELKKRLNAPTRMQNWSNGCQVRVKTKGPTGGDSAEAWETTHWPLVCVSEIKHFIHYKAWSENKLLGAQRCSSHP